MMEAPKDMISNLPDSLLHYLLSFLEIKDVARSSILSKRWNYIWTTVPILEFKNDASQTENFMDFVDGTLLRHNSSNVDKFSLVCNRHLDESRLHSWISTVIRGNVKELSLYLLPRNTLFIPLSRFTCESLTSLELGTLYRFYIQFYRNINLTFPKYISFPRLKRLTLYQFKFSDDCWNEELFSNSPILEELHLEFCIFKYEEFLYFNSYIEALENYQLEFPDR
ncbi:hypothetical protein MKW92_032880 [Papaver armeniacum]|nr:hypothetical protein MKW92_032880 [Papaver armeniacum]